MGWQALVILCLLFAGACAKRSGAALVIKMPADDLDADVYVDGNYVGAVEAVIDPRLGPVLLAPGTHRVELRKPGTFPVQRTVRVDRRSPERVVIEAQMLTDPQ